MKLSSSSNKGPMKVMKSSSSMNSLPSSSKGSNRSIVSLSSIKNAYQSSNIKQDKKPKDEIGSKTAQKLAQKDKENLQKQQKNKDNSTIDELDDDDDSVSTVSEAESVQSALGIVNAKRNRVLNYIVFLCESELFLEKLRQKVCSFQDFEPYAAFQRLNRQGKREIDVKDICDFMDSVSQHFDSSLVKNLLWFYDLDKSKSLSYAEFMAIVITTEDDELRTKVSLRPTYKVNVEEYMQMNTEVALGNLLFQLITSLDKLDEFRTEMETDFNLEEFIEAFDFLDKNKTGEINDSDFIDFLRDQGYCPSQLLGKNIMRKFKGPNAEFIESDEENTIIGYDAQGNPIYKKSMDKLKFVRFLVPNMDKNAIKHAFEILKNSKNKIPIRDKRSFEIRKEWLEIFSTRVEPEKEIEYCKQDLSMCNDFSAYDMFTLINSDQNEYISLREFVDSLKELGVQPYKDELFLFFRRHARNKKKGLRKKEFKLAILPNQHMFDKVAKGRTKVSKDNKTQVLMKDILEPDTLLKFKKLIMALLKFELKIEAISLKLAKLQTFSYEEFFELLDPESKGSFSYQNLKDVFIEHKIDITEKELSFLFERLDCKEKDQKITYIEFLSEVQPHLPKNLIGRRFTTAQRMKQAQSMANVIDSDLNLQSRAQIDSMASFPINSFTNLKTE